MGIKEEFGRKIKRMRIARGLTQETLAEMVDISQRALSAIETGENFVTAETLDKLIQALNTNAEEIFATNHLKNTEELITQIDDNIKKLSGNPIKIEIIYNITKSLLNE